MKNTIIFISLWFFLFSSFAFHSLSQNIYDGLDHIVPITLYYEPFNYNITKDKLFKKFSAEKIFSDSNGLYLTMKKDSTSYKFFKDGKLKSFERYDSVGNLEFEIKVAYDKNGNVEKIIHIEGKPVKTVFQDSFFKDAPGIDQESIGNSLQERTSYCTYLYSDKGQILSEERFNGKDVRVFGSYLEYNSEGEIISETMVSYPDKSRGTYSYTYYTDKIVRDYTENGVLIDRSLYDLRIKKWHRTY